jgi:hypothetical protein
MEKKMNKIDVKNTNNDYKVGIEKIEKFITKEHYIIKHFINALNHLILVEMDIKEWINKKEKQAKIIPYYKSNDNIILKFGADDFLYNKPFPMKQCIDAYGSAIYDINGIEVSLFNTYGEKDYINKRYENTNYISLLPVCFIYDDFIEVADIVLLKKIMPRKKFFIFNHMISKIPKELKNIKIGGYNAFRFYPSERLLSLRLLNKNVDIPQVYKCLDSEDWESLPQVKIHLEPLI